MARPGTPAALSLPWLAVCIGAAGYGAWRFLPRGRTPAGEAAIEAGLAYLAVGGAWLVAARAGWAPLGFRSPVAELTAAHFHYIPAALVVVGVVGRCVPSGGRARRAYAWSVAGSVAGPALVAAGIAGPYALELGGTILLVASLLVASAVGLAHPPPSTRPLARALVRAALLVPFATRPLALLYGMRRVLGSSLSIDRMLALHAWPNAVGFVGLGLVGWALARPPRRAPLPGIPFSRLRGARRIGADFFSRVGAVDRGGGPVRGLVDDLDAYDGPETAPRTLPDSIRAFYEDTARFGLLVVPRWHAPWRALAPLYKRLAARLEQMNLPLEPGRGEERIESALLPLDDRRDGRAGVRAWVRTYRASGRAVYAAAYAHHRVDGRTYMNIAFPLPGGNVTSILRPETIVEGGSSSLLLTTRPRGEGPGDEGVYFVTGGFGVRLPTDETIEVWEAGRERFGPPPGARLPAATRVAARHRIRVLGRPALTLLYYIFPKEEGS